MESTSWLTRSRRACSSPLPAEAATRERDRQAVPAPVPAAAPAADRAAQQMGIASLARAGLPGQQRHQRPGRRGIRRCSWIACRFRPRGQTIERGGHRAQVVEGIHPVSSAAKLAGSLRPPQQQQAKQRRFVATQIQDGANTMLILRHPGVAVRRDESPVPHRTMQPPGAPAPHPDRAPDRGWSAGCNTR